jgi:ribosome-binding protein aMBF1 (putative translation factor)
LTPVSKIANVSTVTGPDAISPVGTSVEEAIRRRSEDPVYRRQYDRLAEFEGVARIVIERRGMLGISQRELGVRVGTTASAISSIESGRHPTTARTLKRVFEALEGRLVIGFEYAADDGTHQVLVSR